MHYFKGGDVGCTGTLYVKEECPSRYEKKKDEVQRNAGGENRRQPIPITPTMYGREPAIPEYSLMCSIMALSHLRLSTYTLNKLKNERTSNRRIISLANGSNKTCLETVRNNNVMTT